MNDREVIVRERVLEDLILEAARAPPEPRALDFKPNPNLGEGEASEMELQYREDLLKCLKRAYNSWDRVLADKATVEDKLEALDPIIDTYVREAQDVAVDFVTTRFLDTVREMEVKLRALGAKKLPKPSKDMNRLVVLLAYQLDAVEWSGIRLKYKIRQALLSDRSMDIYRSPE